LKASIVSSAIGGALVWLALTVDGPIAWSAKPAISTKILLRTTLSGDETKEVIIASAEFPPGSSTGRHTHPGDEYATVLTGTLEILVAAHASKRVNAGESYHNARNVIHEARSIGDRAAQIVSTFVIDKGQPIMQPAH
jgi:quercetin dioxygenase-like cupin family protein